MRELEQTIRDLVMVLDILEQRSYELELLNRSPSVVLQATTLQHLQAAITEQVSRLRGEASNAHISRTENSHQGS